MEMYIGVGIIFLALLLGLFVLRGKLEDMEHSRDNYKVKFLSMERRYQKLEEQFDRLVAGLEKIKTEKRLNELD